MTDQPALIDGHEFDGYPWGDEVICVHPVGDPPHACGRPAAEHAQVPAEASEVGGDPGQ